MYSKYFYGLFYVFMKIISRLAQYIDYKQLSLNGFDVSIGTSGGYIGKQIKKQASIGSDIIQKILSVYQDLNPLWLITGEGEMLKGEGSPPPTIIPNLENEMLKKENDMLRQQNDELRKDKEFLQRIIENKQN